MVNAEAADVLKDGWTVVAKMVNCPLILSIQSDHEQRTGFDVPGETPSALKAGS
jgi:hypothetical protein